MKNLKFGPIGLLVLAVLAAFTATPARAQEGYAYSSFQGFSASFFLIGGQYELYVNALSLANCYFAHDSQNLNAM